MNQEKIGKFIAVCRKEKNLTQSDLAEKLQITNKAISKWETGRGMPDSSLLLNLCEILDISVNELLSGERLHQEKYLIKAEENIISIAKESDKTKIKNKIIIVSLMILLMISFILLIVSRYFGGFLIDENGNFNSNIALTKDNLTHIIYFDENLDDNIQCEIIYSFKNDKCVSERIKFTFNDEKTASEQYENWKNIENNTNLEKNGTEVSFNANTNIGKNKQEIMNSNNMKFVIY